MAILWCGGEDVDFLDSGVVGIRTDGAGSYYRTGYARCAIYHGTDPYIYSKVFSGGSVTSCWLHFYCYSEDHSAGSFYYDKLICGLCKSGTTKGLWIYQLSKTTLGLYKYDGTTLTQLATATNGFVTGKFDMQVVNHGASATVNIYKNSVLQLTYSGDTTLTGFTAIDMVGVGGWYDNYLSYNRYQLLSEIIVATDNTTALNLVTHYPNATGDANAWSGDGYGGIDETTTSDTDMIYVDAASQDAQFNMSNLPSGTWGVAAVKVIARAIKAGNAVNATKINLGIRSGGVNDIGSDQSVDAAYRSYERLMSQINSAKITSTMVDGMQINLRSIA